MKKYELLEHTADIKIRAYGKDEKEAFSNSLIALKKIIIQDKKTKNEIIKKIEIIKEKKEELLHGLLEEIIFLLDSKKLIFSEIKKIEIDKKKIILEAYFQDLKNENLINPVKAITYNDIFIKNEKGKVILEVTLDI